MGVGGAINPLEKRFYNTKRWKGWCAVAGGLCWPALCTLSRILPNPAVYFMWQPPFPSSGHGGPETLSLGSPIRLLKKAGWAVKEEAPLLTLTIKLHCLSMPES